MIYVFTRKYANINSEKNICTLVGFGRACAPVRCAHPSFWAHCHPKRGAARPPAHRSFAASYSTPKNIYNLSNLGHPHQGLFSFHWTTEAMKNEDPCPSKLCTMRPYALIFSVCYFFYSFWIFSFCYSLLFLLSFSISSYSSLLISSYSSL